MRLKSLRVSLAAGVAAVAVFNTLAALSMPRADSRASVLLIMLWLALLVSHAAAYWYADSLRARLGDGGYAALQAGIVFVLIVARAPFLIGAGLYIALTVFVVILAGDRWGTVQITFGAIALFALSAILTSNLYRGATAGLLLAVAGVVGHAVSALFRRDAPPPVAPSTAPTGTPAVAEREPTGELGLTARETQVLRALMRGARNSEIASQLGITERTVKAHLASIYGKLGVESRTAAVAFATRNGVGLDTAAE